MTDILIPNVPEAVAARIDAHAKALGLSRDEFLRRQLVREANRAQGSATWADLQQSSDRFRNLLEDGLMEGAWRLRDQSETDSG
jgi:Ribbon-helix-helix protein, copG family